MAIKTSSKDQTFSESKLSNQTKPVWSESQVSHWENFKTVKYASRLLYLEQSDPLERIFRIFDWVGVWMGGVGDSCAERCWIGGGQAREKF